MEQDHSTKRKTYTPDQKFKIVKEHITTKTSVAEICKKYSIPPGKFHRWLDQFYTYAWDGFKNPKDGPTKAEIRKIESLEKDNSRMKNVISEILFENVDLKKRCGEWGLIE